MDLCPPHRSPINSPACSRYRKFTADVSRNIADTQKFPTETCLGSQLSFPIRTREAENALTADDECQGVSECAVSALQLRANEGQSKVKKTSEKQIGKPLVKLCWQKRFFWRKNMWKLQWLTSTHRISTQINHNPITGTRTFTQVSGFCSPLFSPKNYISPLLSLADLKFGAEPAVGKQGERFFPFGHS